MSEKKTNSDLDAILADFSAFSSSLSSAAPQKPAPPAEKKPETPAEEKSADSGDTILMRDLKKEQIPEAGDKTTVFRSPSSGIPVEEKSVAIPQPLPAKPAPQEKQQPKPQEKAAQPRPQEKKAETPAKANAKKAQPKRAKGRGGAWLILLIAVVCMALCSLGYRLIDTNKPAPSAPQLHLMDSLDSYFPEEAVPAQP